MKRENLAIWIAVLALVVAIGHGHPWAAAGVSFSGGGVAIDPATTQISWASNLTPEIQGAASSAVQMRAGSSGTARVENNAGTIYFDAGTKLDCAGANVDISTADKQLVFGGNVGIYAPAVGILQLTDTTVTPGPGALALLEDSSLPTAGTNKVTFAAEDRGGRSRFVAVPDAGGNHYPGGTLTTNVTAAGTGAATAETDLQTYSLPANTLGTAGGVRITAAGTTSGALGARTVRFYFGSATLGTITVTNTGADWAFHAVVVSDAATNAQVILVEDVEGSAFEETDIVRTAALDTTTAVTIKTTGQTADAGDEITSEILLVELIP